MSEHAHSDIGMQPKTFPTYMAGTLICIILTLIPFAAVHYRWMSKPATLWLIYLFAIAQFFVQVICFLRLSMKTEQGRTNIYAFVFTGIVLAAIVGGSLWIMYHLNYNMMH